MILLPKHLQKNYPHQIVQGDSIPSTYRKYVEVEAGSGGHRKRDVVTPFVRGKEWFFELVKPYMPKVWDQFMCGGELFLLSDEPFDVESEYLSPVLCMKYGENILFFPRGLYCKDEMAREGHRIGPMPNCIKFPFYKRLRGFGYLTEHGTRYFDGLVAGINEVITICNYLKSCRRFSQDIGFFEELFPGLTPEPDWPYTKFYAFIWSVPDENKNQDVLLQCEHMNSTETYYIRDHDFRGMMRLNNPQEAIDGYLEHTLIEKPGRFDFMPYAENL